MNPVFARIYLALVFLILVTENKAQDKGFFDQIWLEEGLSQSSITAIARDKQGFMWFGTQDGLNRYDGRRMDRLNTRPFHSVSSVKTGFDACPSSLSGGTIMDLGVDSSGKLWALSVSLDKIDPRVNKVSNLANLLAKNIGKDVWLIKMCLLNDQLYLFTSAGLYRFTPADEQFSLYSVPSSRKTRAKGYMNYEACSGPDGRIYIATSGGIYSCEKGSREFHSLLPEEHESVFSDAVRSLYYHDNKLYFSVSRRLFVYETEKQQLNEYGLMPEGHAAITAILVDNKGYVWVGTEGDGLFRFRNAGDRLIQDRHYYNDPADKYGLKTGMITKLYQGSHPDEDVVWIGSRDAGIFSFSYSKNSFQFISAFLDKSVYNYFGIVKDYDGIIWAGMNKGICGIDRDNKKCTYVEKADWERVVLQSPAEALYCDQNNTVWVGLGNSLYKIDKKNARLEMVAEKLFPEGNYRVLKITGDADDLFIGGTRSAIIYSIKENIGKPFPPVMLDGKSSPVPGTVAILVDKDKNWWLGTGVGIFFYDRKNNKVHQLKNDPSDPKSLLSNHIMDLKESREGDIIVASPSGLSVLRTGSRKNFHFENHYQSEGLANNFIYGLMPDKQGNFWMTTNLGVAVFNPRTKKFRSYTASDGVRINEFNSGGFHASHDGELLFGGIGGLVGLYPEKLVKSKIVPGIVLRSSRVNNAAADSLFLLYGGPIRLTYEQNNIHLEFSMPEFSGKGRTRLLYKLIPAQSDWVEADDSYILSLANLAPGDYKLMAKAVSAEGLESVSPYTLSFLITPPFWNRWWFYSLVAFLLLLISGLLYRHFLRSRIARLEQMERVRQEENERVRKAAALDLHDEFGNGLTRISMLVEMARIKANGAGKEFEGVLNVISENSSRLYQGTKDFIWSIHPGNDNLYEIIIRVKDFGDELFYDTGINFEVTGLHEEDKAIHQLPGTGRNIAMIFKEALSNVLKHAGGDKVRFTVEKKEEKIIMELKDNGRGFKPDSSDKGLGISNMKSRAGKIGAELEVNTAKGEGSRITLTIPIHIKNVSR